MSNQRIFVTGVLTSLVGLAAVLVSIGMLCYNAKFILGALNGPTPITAAELVSVQTPADAPAAFLALDLDGAVESNLVVTEKRRGQETPVSRYLLVPARDKFLAVEVPHTFNEKVVAGHVDDWWRRPQKDLEKAARAVAPGRKEVLLPIRFDGYYPYRSEAHSTAGIAIAIGVVGILVALIGFGLVRSYMTLRHFED